MFTERSRKDHVLERTLPELGVETDLVSLYRERKKEMSGQDGQDGQDDVLKDTDGSEEVNTA